LKLNFPVVEVYKIEVGEVETAAEAAPGIIEASKQYKPDYS